MRVYSTFLQVIIAFSALSIAIASAEEPTKPTVDQTFSAEKESRINELANLSLQDAFDTLNSHEFLEQDAYLNKAIFQALGFRSDAAIGLALNYVQSPQTQSKDTDGQPLYLAKRIFQVFPETALDSLLDLYDSSGPKVRANVIYVMGQMAAGQAVKTLLVEALDDTSYCQELTEESLGQPLRICDVAYNQLVLRYRVKNVLRTIGTGHNIDVRNYYIKLIHYQI